MKGACGVVFGVVAFCTKTKNKTEKAPHTHSQSAHPEKAPLYPIRVKVSYFYL
jgi:hypothetical protein